MTVTQPPSATTRRVAVVGGGISGLSTAWYLLKAARASALDIEVVVYEASDKPGGVIRTFNDQDFVLEQGPDCFISTKPAAIELCRELGLEGEFIATRPEARRSFILHNGKLQPIPKGFFLLAPTSLKALLQTPLLSWQGKLRAAWDLVIPSGQSDVQHDESLASFVRRRFGEEVLARIAQPMVGGIYTADPEKLSLASTFPQFLKMERDFGSVIRGLMTQGTGRPEAAGSEGAKDAAGPRYGLFVSLKGGMEVLINTLLGQLPRDLVKTSSRVSHLERVNQRWRLSIAGDGGSSTADYDAVVMATPAHAAAALMRSSPASDLQAIGDHLAKIPYASCSIVNIEYDESQIDHPMDGAGFVVPLCENRDILAASFSQSKWPHRVPNGSVVLRVFMGGAVQGDICDRPDSEIVSIAIAELTSILGIRGAPKRTMIQTWRSSMAQYQVGHGRIVSEIRRAESDMHGLALAGNGFEGVGIPDCIVSGRRAATKIIDDLTRIAPSQG